jgi:small subunit ribosomal protein S25
MPFMKGVAPIRRTTKYLTNCPLVFKPRVKIMTINFNEEETEQHHSGARDFVFWNLPQVQYRNPDVQIVTFRNLTPSPFITCFLEDSSKIYFDVDSQSNKEIMDRLVRTLGKSAEVKYIFMPLFSFKNHLRCVVS